MMGIVAQRLAGERLHLQHGPIDLIIGVYGARERAFEAAIIRFDTVLDELVAELPLLRTPLPVTPKGEIARRMARAAHGFPEFVTPMIAVAGAVADEIMSVISAVGGVERAYVNNGGDIALFLADGHEFDIGVSGVDAVALGKTKVTSYDKIGGLATSGRGGRSLSLGIADSVTVLAKSAAEADAAATLIANAVDLPGNRKITRECAFDVDPDSDLQAQMVVSGCKHLSENECRTALDAGVLRAQKMVADGRIVSAFLVLQKQSRVAGQRELIDA